MKSEFACAPPRLSTWSSSSAYSSSSDAVSVTWPRPWKRSPTWTWRSLLVDIPRAKAPLWQQSRISTFRWARLCVMTSWTNEPGTAVERRRSSIVSTMAKKSWPLCESTPCPLT